MKSVTVDQIMGFHPCASYTVERVEELRKRYCGKRKGITLKDILSADIPDADKLWLVLRPELIPEEHLHHIAIWCWEKIARPIWEKNYPNDKRPHEAVRVKKLWLKKKTTTQELAAARAAAGSAGGAAAWDAARAAAWEAAMVAAWAAAWGAARDAAWDAVESAAGDAARAAAWAAARDAAGDAAGAAAWAAAGAAAGDAARDAARDAANKKIISHILKKYTD